MSDRKAYLLDTNVLSETRKKKPESKVIEFLARPESDDLFVSALTFGELRKGVALKERSDPEGAARLAEWVDGLEYGFADHILAVDAGVARLWGELSAERSRPVIDTLLAATAIHHRLTLVTRNTEDVSGIDVPVINPWK